MGKTIESDGSTLENAIIILSKNKGLAISKEYDYIEKVCGERDVDFSFKQQTFRRIGEKFYDIIEITFKNSTTREFWFDITASYNVY